MGRSRRCRPAIAGLVAASAGGESQRCRARRLVRCPDAADESGREDFSSVIADVRGRLSSGVDPVPAPVCGRPRDGPTGRGISPVEASREATRVAPGTRGGARVGLAAAMRLLAWRHRHDTWGREDVEVPADALGAELPDEVERRGATHRLRRARTRRRRDPRRRCDRRVVLSDSTDTIERAAGDPSGTRHTLRRERGRVVQRRTRDSGAKSTGRSKTATSVGFAMITTDPPEQMRPTRPIGPYFLGDYIDHSRHGSARTAELDRRAYVGGVLTRALLRAQRRARTPQPFYERYGSWPTGRSSMTRSSSAGPAG